MAVKSQNQLACLKASTNLVEALSKFPWGNVRVVPVHKNTPEEKKMLVSSLPSLNEAFWTLRNASKDTVRELGVSLKKKDDGKFEASWWFEIPPGFESVFEGLDNTRLPSAVETITKLDSPVQAPVPAPEQDREIADWVRAKLKPHQVGEAAHLAAVLEKQGAALSASGTGTGKTYSALGAVFDLNLRPFIICPKAVIPGWERAIKHFGKEDKTLAIANYDLVKTGKIIKKRPSKRSKLGFVVEHVENPYIELGTHYNYSRFKWKLPPDGVVVFDEAHRCKNRDSINTELMIAAANDHVPTVMLSATIGESPIKLYAIAYKLGIYSKLNAFYSWAQGYGCGDKIVRRNPEVKVFDFMGSRKDLQRLHDAIFPKYGTRIRAEDIPDFPENFIMPEIVDMNDDAGKTQQLYDKMELELVKLESEKSAYGSNQLTIRIHFRREIEMLKVPILVDMTSDLIESGNSVVIFVSFTATLEALCQKLMKSGLMNKKCCIFGGNNAQQNEANRKAFHEDHERVIVCNIQASREGIDLHDINGDYPRVSLLTPSDNAQDTLQCLGRIHRIGGKTKCVQKFVFCANTIEEKVAENVRRKINNIHALNDGDFAPVFLKDVDLKGR